MARLTAAEVRNAKPGRHADGGGLYLLVKPSGARSWLLRVQVDGRRRDVGLGSVELASRAHNDQINIPLLHRKTLSLSEARDKCALLKKAAQAGLDPVEERDRDRRGTPTFASAASATFERLRPNWAPRQQKAFLSSLRRHAFPLLGQRRVDQIVASDIQEVLAPIWTEIPDAARKLRYRIGMVLNFSHSKGWRKSEAPGKSVSIGLSKPTKGGNYAAMPFAELPAFVRALKHKPETLGRLALLFTIYTACRSGEVRHACWSHIDLGNHLWHRPSELMKNRMAHTVTLSDAAADILRHVKPLCSASNDLVFPSAKRKPLSDMTLSKVLRSENSPYTVHGFRSSFRDWVAEMMPEVPDAVAEAALAHTVGDKVLAAYKRTDFLIMRQSLMKAWASFLDDKERTS